MDCNTRRSVANIPGLCNQLSSTPRRGLIVSPKFLVRLLIIVDRIRVGQTRHHLAEGGVAGIERRPHRPASPRNRSDHGTENDRKGPARNRRTHRAGRGSQNTSHLAIANVLPTRVRAPNSIPSGFGSPNVFPSRQGLPTIAHRFICGVTAFVPSGTFDNSPPFKRWDTRCNDMTSPVRDERDYERIVTTMIVQRAIHAKSLSPSGAFRVLLTL